MNPLYILYNEALYRPLLNGLVWFYTSLPWQDLGLAIVALTIAIRLILAPFLWKGQKAQKDLAAIQPEIKQIQERFKGDRETQGKAIMELYAKHKVSPFSGCLMMLVQLPVLIALFRVFQLGINPAELKYLYSFITNPGAINPISFGVINLAKGNIFLGVVAALAQYFQTKLITPVSAPSTGKADFSRIIQWQTTYFFPALILLWSYTLPSALTLYWTMMSILGIVQEIISRIISKHGPGTYQTRTKDIAG